MTLCDLNKRTELRTRRLELANDMLYAAASDDKEWLARIDTELAEIELKLEEMGNISNFADANDNHKEPKAYCPDCGAELVPRMHRQLVEPFHTYMCFYCLGRCNADFCTKDGLDPKQNQGGVPKIRISLNQGLIDLDQLILSVAATVEIERIFTNVPYDFAPYDLVRNVYDRTLHRYRNSRDFALGAVYLTGWVCGIRAERERRKEKRRLSSIANTAKRPNLEVYNGKEAN